MTRMSAKHGARSSVGTGAALVLSLLVAVAAGCGGDGKKPARTAGGGVVTDSSGNVISKAAAVKFKDALAEMQRHDAASDWNDATCKATADMFTKAAGEQGDKEFLEAKYNAGVAYQRCKNNAEAKRIFKEVLERSSEFHRARVQVALYDFQESGEKNVDAALSEMERAVTDAKFQNVEALVNLAMFQMLRQSDSSDDDGANDFERAKKNLQRALAVNDAFMPAFNQLAVYYYEMAKRKAGRKESGRRGVAAASAMGKKADPQALELAALVCSQAIRKNPRYAPVYNTMGLISAELGDLSAAARSFGQARDLDKKFFEAHMNYAAVNLQFRGFQQAEAAYRDALKLRPNDYEATLGLALAVRALINDTNFDKNFKEVVDLLAKAKSLDPDRPETYYNEAIFTQEYKTREGGEKGEKMLLEAKAVFEQFVGKAEGREEYAAAVKRAKELMKEIDQIIEFNRQSAKEAEEQKKLEQERKRKEAEEKSKPKEAPKDEGAGGADKDGAKEGGAGDAKEGGK
ncbi:MAG: hypothetical protein HY744_10130 [Deltaproteobacteria bacterium]|nr:hypothetical protein [Deltaproteobacteria bacterium]